MKLTVCSSRRRLQVLAVKVRRPWLSSPTPGGDPPTRVIPNGSSRSFRLTESVCACEFSDTLDEGHAAVMSLEEMSEDFPILSRQVPRPRACRREHNRQTLGSGSGPMSLWSGGGAAFMLKRPYDWRVESHGSSRRAIRLPCLRENGTLPDHTSIWLRPNLLGARSVVEVPLLQLTCERKTITLVSKRYTEMFDEVRGQMSELCMSCCPEGCGGHAEPGQV